MGIHLAGIVAGVSLVPATLTLLFRHKLPLPASLLLGHASFVGFAVALASTDLFAAHSTQLLGKNLDGHISSWSLALFYPCEKNCIMQGAIPEVPLQLAKPPTPYAGGWPSTPKWLPPGNPSVIDVTCELPRRHNQPYMCLPTWDTHGPSVERVEEGVEWLLQQRAAGRPVYVHCAHGHGRSTVVLCAALVASGHAETFQEAFDEVKSLRPRVKLNYRQRRTLVQWAERRSKLAKST